MIFRRERHHNFRSGDLDWGKTPNSADQTSVTAHRLARLASAVASAPNTLIDWRMSETHSLAPPRGRPETPRRGSRELSGFRRPSGDQTRAAAIACRLSRRDVGSESPSLTTIGGPSRPTAGGPEQRQLNRSPPRWMSSEIASTPPPPTRFRRARPRWRCAAA